MKVSIVIPNYNGADLLRKNIPIVTDAAESYQENAEIIVVDDASTDESLQVLKEFKKVKVISNSNNLGFADSVNKGVREAEGEIVILLNSDVRPEKNFLSFLMPHFQDQKVFAAGCMDKSYENGKIVERGRGVGSWKRGFMIHEAGEIRKGNTLWANGGSSAFRKDMWIQLGGFSYLYKPFYWEDIDLSYRAWKTGYKVIFEPRSVVHHEHEKGAIQKTFSSSYIKTVAYKNQFVFVWRNITDFSLVVSHILWLPYLVLVAIKNRDWRFIKGFLQALLLFPESIQSNIVSRKKFNKSDSEVLSLFIT